MADKETTAAPTGEPPASVAAAKAGAKKAAAKKAAPAPAPASAKAPEIKNASAQPPEVVKPVKSFMARFADDLDAEYGLGGGAGNPS